MIREWKMPVGGPSDPEEGELRKISPSYITEHRGGCESLSLAQQLGLVPALDLGKQE